MPKSSTYRPDHGFDALPVLLIGAIVAITWLRLAPTVEDAGWIGWDAYPILLASQVETSSDVVEVATRRLAGEHLKASFYRPLFMLSVSAEQAFFSASPKTSLTIQVGLFGLCLMALWWWIGSWRGGADGDHLEGDDPRPGGLVALALVSMHPAVFDVVPYMPRRADLLCVLFVLLALRLDRLWLVTGRRPVLAASLVCAALAMASKETAILLPLFVVAARWLAAKDCGRLKPLAAYGAAVGVVLLPRLAVLGGAGGYPDASRNLPFSPKLLLVTWFRLLVPESGVSKPGLGALAVGLLVLGGLGAIWTSRAAIRRHRLATFAGVWVLLLSLLFAVVGRVSPWYLLFAAFGAFVGVADLAHKAWSELRSSWRWRLWGNAWLAGLGLLLVVWWPGSLLAGSTDELRDAGVAVTSCLEQTARQCARADERSSRFRGCRELVEGNGRSVAVVKPRSVAAWVEWSGLACGAPVPASGRKHP